MTPKKGGGNKKRFASRTGSKKAWTHIIVDLHEKRLLIYIIIAIGFLFALFLFDPKLYTGGDNATYISLAKSLLSGNGYRDIYRPEGNPHTQYPPGYPLLLSGIMFFTGDNFVFLKLFSVLLFLSSIYIFYLILRRRSSNLLIYIPLLLLALSPELLEHSHWILTEVTFLFLLLLTVYLFERWKSSKSFMLFFSASLSAVMAYYVRSIGIAVILGAFTFLLYSHELKKALIFLIIVFTFVTPWVIRTSKIPQQGGYLDQFLSRNPYDLEASRIGFVDLITRIGTNSKIYGMQVIPSLIFPSFHGLTQPHQPLKGSVGFLSVIILGILFYGLKKDIRKGGHLYHFLLLFYFSISLAWPPVWSSPRFLVPILPFVLLLFFSGANLKIKNFSFSLILLSIIATFSSLHQILPKLPKSFNIIRSYMSDDKMAGYSLDWIRYYEAADWVKSHTPATSVVLSRKPNLFFLKSNRKGFVYPMTFDQEKVRNSIIEADYIVIDHFFWTGTTRKYLVPALNTRPDWFEVIHVTADPQTVVLRVNEEIKK